ncbi:transposase [Flavipsychrobacter stenotrophus]|uniref:Transposase n=2 Tax=Flavipsychrobacter stenotrophus TaxID=2077091 RepID=A0A2S7SZN9_9BACT|nr:transposase [Flavipsychrobacter stenotrophus]
MPRIGTRKLHYMLTETLEKHNISIGRNKLFDLLADYGLLVRRRKRKRINTTDSNHPFRRYPNLIRELRVLRPNHLWVSDITYLSLSEGFCYLSLVTDAYSRRIVGYCLYPTLKKEGPLNALKMALNSLNYTIKAALIHHSDRGLQYCCADYTSALADIGISISMTEKGDPYENAIAERVNGILKCEFAIDRDFKDIEQAKEEVDNAIAIYNQLRPHASCDYLTPDQAHQKERLLTAKWKRRLVMT